MKIKRILLLLIICALSVTSINVIKADTSYDVTAPELINVQIKNNDIDADKSVELILDVVEEGSGIKTVSIDFANNETNQIVNLTYDVNIGNSNKLLFTGEHTITFDLTKEKAYFLKGSYHISNIELYDVTENKIAYDTFEKVNLNVTNSDISDKTGPVIKELIMADAGDFKDSTYNKGVVVVEEQTGLKELLVTYVDDKNNEIVIEGQNIKGLVSGKYEIDFSAINNFKEKGNYKLKSIYAKDYYGNVNIQDEFSADDFTDSIFVNSLLKEENTLGIQQVQIVEKSIITPSALTLKLKVNRGTKSLKGVNISIVNENGNRKALYWQAKEKLTTEEITIKFAINTYLENGKYTIDEIAVYDENVYRTYSNQELNVIMTGNRVVNIKSNYDIVYYGSTANINGVIRAIQNMKTGDIAIVECSVESIADKSIFQALAGKDLTVIFEEQDVQWIFNGKNIKPEKCKSIDLKVNMSVKKAVDLGYADANDMLVIDFADNGELPGQASIRLSNEFLKVKYDYKTNLTLSYYDRNPEILNQNIDCAKDGYVEISVSHNSTYILSDSAPRFAAPSNFAVQGNYTKSNALSWHKVFGATGYKVYRLEGNEKKYKLIATLKGNNTSVIEYTDTELTAGENYNYRVCAYGNNVEAVYSKTLSIRVISGRAVLKVKSVGKRKKIKISLSTSDKIKNFAVYISKDGKRFKKIKMLKNKTNYTVNASKYKKRCFIKVRSYVEHNNRKYYGQYSTVKKVKLK